MLRPFIRVVTLLLILIAVGCESDGANAKGSAAGASATPAAATATPPVSPKARSNDLLYAYVDAVRADLSDGKAQLINQVMRLSQDEAAKFWPIYHEYEDELFALGDRRVETTRKFVNAQATDSLNNDSAAALAVEWFDFENKRLELLRKYHERIGSELSPLRAAQFTQVEHRVGTVIDLVLASELPLVRTAPQRAAPQGEN